MTDVSSTQLAVAALLAAIAASVVSLHAQRNRVQYPFAWACAVFLFLGIALPFYVLHVRRARRQG